MNVTDEVKLPTCAVCNKPADKLVFTSMGVMGGGFKVAAFCHGDVEVVEVGMSLAVAAALVWDDPKSMRFDGAAFAQKKIGTGGT